MGLVLIHDQTPRAGIDVVPENRMAADPFSPPARGAHLVARSF
jgi:hypothetical protein